MPALRNFIIVGGLIGLALIASPAPAQDLPPVAAPTVSVGVASLPIVRSESQEMADFTAGLLQGLLPSHNIEGLALIIVEGDHVMVQQHYGSADAAFSTSGLSHIVTAIAAMQLIEQARILPGDDASDILSETNLRGVTVAQLLTRQADAPPDTLGRIVARVSGQPLNAYVRARIFMPLGMNRSNMNAGNLVTTASDMGRLMLALLNGGAYEDGRILQPETVELMQRSHVTLHPGLPGWSYGLAEMHRGGWRALHHDGRVGEAEARLVLIPDRKLGYFIAVNRLSGRAALMSRFDGDAAEAGFWRVLDHALFDRLLSVAPGGVAAIVTNGTAAPPTAEDAAHAAGLYRSQGGMGARAVFLKSQRGGLLVRARENGALELSGARVGVLFPRPGGFWLSNDGGLAAAIAGRALVVGSGVYRRISLWERPALYLLLGALAGMAALLVFARPDWISPPLKRGARTERLLGYGLTFGAGAALFAAVLLQLLVAL